MKTIYFRPLRKNQKGKIIVASYAKWRSIKTADRNGIKLIINQDYKTYSKNQMVFNHKGENLFWRNYNPELIPTLNPHELMDGEQPPYPKQWKTDYEMYSAKGLDCDGVPTFSNWTANEIIKDQTVNQEEFTPLTVEIVNWWIGWFLYKLQNTQLN